MRSVGVKNHVCSKDMHGYFFQCFYFFCVKKIPNHGYRTFVEFFFRKKKTKKLKKYSTQVRWTYMVFFFQVFLFFFLKKKIHACPKTCLVFFNFFSNFDVFQACPSDMRGNFCCIKNQKLELPRVKSLSYSRFRFR